MGDDSDRWDIAQGMAQRSLYALGYLPWRTMSKLGDTDSCSKVFLTSSALPRS